MSAARGIGLWAAALALLLAGCGKPAVQAHPAMWRVRDADTTIWLLGTIHALPREVQWETPAIHQAIEEAGSLVLELPDDPAALTTAFAATGHTARPVPIGARVAPERRAALAAAIDATHLSADALSGMKTWAAALAIGSAAASSTADADHDHGLEAVLTARFKARGRPLGALETPAAQFAAFDTLPEPAQRVLLDRAIASASTSSTDYRATLAAWAAGDEKRIAATIDPAFRAAPAIEALLVTGRNARWTAEIAQRMAQPGRVLVAVGVGHLVGAQSLPAMLRARGYRVERVE